MHCHFFVKFERLFSNFKNSKKW